MKGFQRKNMFNAVKYHPEDLDPFPAPRHRQHRAELSALEGGGPAAAARDGWWFARGWDPGDQVFLLLEKTENSASLVQDDGMQEGRREHWGHFLVLFKVLGKSLLRSLPWIQRASCCQPYIRRGLKHPEQCLDRANVT